MEIKLHKQATTTPKIRVEIQAAPSSISDSELAPQNGVAVANIRRWRYRDDVRDRSHKHHNLLAALTSEQEKVLIAVREFLRLGLDLLIVAREFLNPRLSRSGLHRMLKQKRYLYVAIDRVTRWVSLEVRRSQSAKVAQTFLKRVEEKVPFMIQTVLTDNGKMLTDRFMRAGELKPGGCHPFGHECQALGIEHRLFKPGRPQTKGMVERFKQTLKRYTCLSIITSREGAAPSIIDCGDEGM